MKFSGATIILYLVCLISGFAGGTAFNIRDYGASDSALDTVSIQKALDACAAGGGGMVVVPPGNYLSGSLKLSSHTTLKIEAGATLLASRDQKDYPASNAFLTADDADDITLTGDGTINGQATADLRTTEAEKLTFRVRTLVFKHCQNVTMSHLTILNSDDWTLDFQRCEHLAIDEVTIHNNYHRINTDGIDPDMCTNVRISHCHIISGDDCIVIKTTKTDPCKDVIVSDCDLQTSATALKLGTESFGDFSNILFTNCTVSHSFTGLGLYCYDGGTMQNIIFSHIHINMGIFNHATTPIYVSLAHRAAGSTQGHIQDVTFEDLDIKSGSGALILSAPGEPVENLTLRNINFRVDQADSYVNRMNPTGSHRMPRDNRDLIYTREPSYITIANASNVSLRNINVSIDAAAFQMYGRAAFFGANIDGLSINGLERSPAADASGVPIMNLQNCHLLPGSQ